MTIITEIRIQSNNDNLILSKNKITIENLASILTCDKQKNTSKVEVFFM